METKTVLITGAARGIGAAISERFHSNGYDVCVPSRNELDLNSPESIQNWVNANDRPIHVLINNAGINTLADLDHLSDAILDDMLQVNLKGPIQLIRALRASPHRTALKRIVSISSVWSIVSKEGRLAYTASKSAINGITRSLALELAPDQVLINAVAPGFVDTALTRQNNSPQDIFGLEAQIPLGRMAQPSEIAQLVYFLGSDMNTYITGQTYLIDGGYTCR